VTELYGGNENHTVTCMVTETVDRATSIGSNRIVLCAHIIPKSAKSAKNLEKLLNLGFIATDVDSIRNALFLVSGIEWAFDRLLLSFGRNPMNPLSDQLYLRIFDMTACETLPLYEGSDQFVSSYNNRPLLLNGHEPFQTALCLHEFSCHMKYKDTTNSAVRYEIPVFHSSLNRAGNPYVQQIETTLDFYRRAMAEQIAEQIEDEI
jgi:HNH endonuclease